MRYVTDSVMFAVVTSVAFTVHLGSHGLSSTNEYCFPLFLSDKKNPDGPEETFTCVQIQPVSQPVAIQVQKPLNSC